MNSPSLTALSLKTQFLSLLSTSNHPTQEERVTQSGPTPSLAESWWFRLCEHYAEDGRHYHTLDHIAAMFRLFSTYKSKLTSHETVGWAIIFHDVIYNPKAGDNEEQSAELFRSFARESLTDSDTELVQEVDRLIRLTKMHCTEAHQVSGMYASSDEHYFLDFDMQVLGLPETEYASYAQKIRAEYIHVPEMQYRTARAQILKEFLKTPNIFATQDFRELYEIQARDNIKREIQQLES
ncbi:uncharacterized protein [Asterias amurensis]|uniref:uncharacterized protein n=1 Tax=Asterias amurensis TaxID=7602 RepID=UPI003AB1FADD